MVHTIKYTPWINTCEYIILHHTWWTLDFNSQVKYLSEHKDLVSVHYVVWQSWEIAQIWNDKMILWHCWVSSFSWMTDMNKYSIWIEVVWPWFTDIQREAVSKLIIDISKKYNIPKENILRHKDITIRKTDIDDTFWNNKFNSWNDFVNFLYAWEYEKQFTNKYWKWFVFNDLDWALKKCINEDWTLNTREFFFLTMIWLERVNNKIKPIT